MKSKINNSFNIILIEYDKNTYSKHSLFNILYKYKTQNII